MRLNSIELENFRKFPALKLELSKDFNLLIGDNGAGKTSILEALSVAASTWFLKIPRISARNIRTGDIRRVVHDSHVELYEELSFPVKIRALIETDSLEPIAFTRSLDHENGRTRAVETNALSRLATEKVKGVSSGALVDLPLICYYGAGRLWKQPSQTNRKSRPSRLDGYYRAIDPRIHTSNFIQWMKKQAFAHVQDNASKAYVAVCDTIEKCFLEDTEVKYSIRRDRLEVKIDNTIVAYDQLSDGQRSIVSLIGDLAVRAVTLNPHYNETAPQKTKGVVLIDEIDLHLHPKWQRSIVEVLSRSFPEIQFIATTHSPFVIQNMRIGKVINLDKPLNIETEPTYNRSIEEIVEHVQGVDNPTRSLHHKKMSEVALEYIEKVENANDAQEIQSMDEDLNQLLEKFSDDPATTAALKFERLSAELTKPKTA